MAASEKKYYARVQWSAEDIRTFRKDWTYEQCEQWLEVNAKYIQERLVEVGYGVIEDLLGCKEDE